jgi:hypothetical protein
MKPYTRLPLNRLRQNHSVTSCKYSSINQKLTISKIKKGQLFQADPFAFNGRDDWIRTSGPLLPKQVRYQAALHPV